MYPNLTGFSKLVRALITIPLFQKVVWLFIMYTVFTATVHAQNPLRGRAMIWHMLVPPKGH
jgi:hypothetical protein